MDLEFKTYRALDISLSSGKSLLNSLESKLRYFKCPILKELEKLIGTLKLTVWTLVFSSDLSAVLAPYYLSLAAARTFEPDTACVVCYIDLA